MYICLFPVMEGMLFSRKRWGEFNFEHEEGKAVGLLLRIGNMSIFWITVLILTFLWSYLSKEKLIVFLLRNCAWTAIMPWNRFKTLKKQVKYKSSLTYVIVYWSTIKRVEWDNKFACAFLLRVDYRGREEHVFRNGRISDGIVFTWLRCDVRACQLFLF